MNSHNNENDNSTYGERCARFGRLVNTFLLKYQDESDIENWVKEQVELVGGNRDLYDMINTNMKQGYMDPFFIREHCDIYAWRETFFHQHFPKNKWFTVDFVNEGFPFDPEDECSIFITVPYQITMRFEEVMALASSKVDPEFQWLAEEVYFDNDENLSDAAECKFKWKALTTDYIESYDDVLGNFCQDIGLSFSDVASMIVEYYRTGPKKLEEICLKALLCHYHRDETLLLKSLPTLLVKKAEYGFYSVEDDTPDNISDEGKKLFKWMKNLFSDIEEQ